MTAALKILVDVAVFRLKKLEMANLITAGAVMVALGLAWADMAVRFGFGLLLNLLAYLSNDYFDVDQDLESPNKDRAKCRFLKDHMGAALGAQVGLAVFLALVAIAWSPDLLVPLVLGAGICWIYSWKLKRVPYIDVISMIVWGMTMSMVGLPLDRALGWLLVCQAALFSACFESIQVIRDHDEDLAEGVRTTAVRLGIPATRVLLRAFMIVSAAYAALFLHRWIGLALLACLFLPLDPKRADVYWTRQRFIMGIVFVAMIGWIWWTGSGDGWLLAIDRGATIDRLSGLVR
ncbi:MAG: UbiA family prenyltransferase [Proteobacteria bacterium]|jgi:4-hydroxybenzoate polyprenyltransferase|nr:UbiA family prenyltransferase [Pseudomonadota bacterium]